MYNFYVTKKYWELDIISVIFNSVLKVIKRSKCKMYIYTYGFFSWSLSTFRRISVAIASFT